MDECVAGIGNVATEIIPDGCIDIIWTGERLGRRTRHRPIFESFAAGTVIVGSGSSRAPHRHGSACRSEIVNSRALCKILEADARRLRIDCMRSGPRRAAELMLSALASRSPRPSLFDPALRAVANAFARDDGDRVRLSELAATLGLSERTLRRRCEIAFGYGPKTLERILRFQQFLALLRRSPAPRLAELAAASGFADQAHLTREVRRLGGLTPTAFMTQFAA
jgi:AraC-like DNA-binding protein